MQYYSVHNEFYKTRCNGNINNEKLRRYFRNVSLIVVRTRMTNSRPCSRCLELIKQYNIKRVYYSYDGDLVMEKTRDIETDHVSSKYRRPWSEWDH